MDTTAKLRDLYNLRVGMEILILHPFTPLEQVIPIRDRDGNLTPEGEAQEALDHKELERAQSHTLIIDSIDYEKRIVTLKSK